ncbi:MAG: hypothetical protein HYV07_25100 [Deltaproteobacteria bacterium]|nr:hypothetical protein [Deltaproteobacteria bacterium]
MVSAALPESPVAVASVKARTRPWHIHGPFFDSFWIIGMPLLALGLIVAFCLPRVPGQSILGGIGTTPPLLLFFAGCATYTHINITVARIYMNKQVFRRFPKRLVLAPVFAFTILAINPNLLTILIVVALLWDEYHSFMQTFGFARIYDSKLGNDPATGRYVDMVACFVLEWLPYLVAVTFAAPDFHDIMNVGPEYYLRRRARFVPPELLQAPLVLFAMGFLIFYVGYWAQKAKEGYRVSKAKIGILASTGIANWVLVTHYTLIEGGAMANIYHGLQYIAIIWVSERMNLTQVLHTKKLKYAGIWIAFIAIAIPSLLFAALRTNGSFVLAIFGEGIATTHPTLYSVLSFFKEMPSILFAFWATTSLLHYWVDGFVWSVRKNEAV